MATTNKKKATKKVTAAKTKATRAPGEDVAAVLSAVRKIVDGPNSPKGAIDELRNHLSVNGGNKTLQPVGALVNDAHTDGETLHNLREYLRSKNA